MSSLPLAENQIEIQRGLTTSSTAIFIPFTTQELFQSGKESLYYGLNALSQTSSWWTGRSSRTPNGLILGYSRFRQILQRQAGNRKRLSGNR